MESNVTKMTFPPATTRPDGSYRVADLPAIEYAWYGAQPSAAIRRNQKLHTRRSFPL